MKIHYKILTITLMIISVLFINIPVFADTFTGNSGDEHGGSSGGFGVADGQVITIDYVKQNPSLFSDFDIISEFQLYNDPFLHTYFNAWAELNYSSEYVSKLVTGFYNDWFRSKGATWHNPSNCPCGACVNSSKYAYFAISYSKTLLPIYKIFYTENPITIKNNVGYDTGSHTNSTIWNADNSGFQHITGGGNHAFLEGKEVYKLFDNTPTANGRFDNLTVLYPLPNNKIMKIVDGGGNTFANTGEYADLEKGYRQQKILEQYSKYEPENYPKSTQLKRKTNWIKTPDIAYHDDGITKSGGNKAFKGFYFNKISSPNGPTINILESGRYTYHLYLWRDGKWRPVSIWSTKVLTFKNSINYGSGYIKPPILSTQTKTYAVILDYETNTLSAVNDDNAFVSGAISNKTPYVITSNSYYIVNDDLAVLSDSSSGNRGSDIFNEFDKDIYDTNGDNQGAGVDNGGTYYPPNRFEPLPKPEMGASIFEWINYFIDNIDKVFSAIGEGIKSIGENVSSFFGLIASVFSFLPSEVWTILAVGLSIVVILRALGR